MADWPWRIPDPRQEGIIVHDRLPQHPAVCKAAWDLDVSPFEIVGALISVWGYITRWVPDGWGQYSGSEDVILSSALTFRSEEKTALWLDTFEKYGLLLPGREVDPAWVARRMVPAARSEWDSLRTSLSPVVFERDNYLCIACGSHEDLTVDHIKPLIRGGDNSLENLQTLCRPCNSRKGAS
jgi:hypothetical protein